MLAWLLLALVPSVNGVEGWPVARGPSREPSPYRFDAKEVKTIPKDLLDDSVAIVLYSGSTYRIEPDGTIETTTHEVTRLNSRKAIENLGEFRHISYTPGYQKLTLHVARIHKFNGKTVEVEPQHVHLRDVATDFQVYDSDKQLVVSFPGLEVGDVIEAKWSVRGKNPEHDGRFFQRYSFGDATYPIRLDELRVLVPLGTTLKAVTTKGLLPIKVIASTSKGEGLMDHRWQARDCPAPPKDENLPSREEMRPSVQVSTFGTWEEVGRWKAKIRATCWECTDKVRRVVAETTRGLKTPQEKARALTYYVRRNVRYLSAGHQHDYTPHKPQTVLENRAGDCKDSSQLLAVMLREVGIAVELVTLGTLDDGQISADLPSPWGTHAILAVQIADKTHWIDTTARLCAWDELPSDDCDRLCYLTDDKGKIRLARTPPCTADHRRTQTTTEVWIDEEGNTINRRVLTAYGLAALAQRGRFVEVPAGERRRLMTSTLQDSNSRSRLVKLAIDEVSLANQDQPAKVEAEFEIPRQFSGSTERDGSFADNATWAHLLAYSIDHERTTPLVLPSVFHSTHVYRVHLPAGWDLDSVPRPREHRSKWGRFVLTVQNYDDEKRLIEMTFDTRLERSRVEPEDLDVYRDWFDKVQQDYRAWLTLRPTSSASGAKRLEKFVKEHPENVPAAKALARLYLKLERKADARRMVEQTAKIAPEDDELLDLRLDAAETEDQEEAARRQRVIRRPGQRQEVLGLAAVLITRDKHDEARKLLTEVLKTANQEERAKAHFQLARSHYRRDELPTALEQLDRAAKADAATVNTIRAWRLRGQIAEEQKKPAEALAAYRKAYERDETNEEVQLILIRLAIETKDERTALEYLRRYTLRNRRNVSGLVLAAQTYYKLRHDDEALDAALRARDITFHEAAQRVIGLVALRRKEYARALDHLDRAEPDAVVVAGLIRAAILAGKPASLPGIVDKAIKVDPSSDDLRSLLNEARKILERRKAAGDAVACAEFAWRLGLAARAEELLADQRNGPALALRARLALERGRLREALRQAEDALKCSPDEALALLVRGRVGFERDTPGHLADLEKAVKRTERTDADALQSLAEALSAAGRRAEAVQAAKEALILRPRDTALAALLAQLQK